MSFENRFANLPWLEANGYNKHHYSNALYARIGNSKYFYGVEYKIKNFDKHFKIENNPFVDNSNKEVNNSVYFFFDAISDDLILYYHITGNTCNTEFKRFKIEKCSEMLTGMGTETFYRSEYLNKARNELEKFLVDFLDNNCIGIEKDLVLDEIKSLNKEKKQIEIKISRLEQSLKENYGHIPNENVSNVAQI